MEFKKTKFFKEFYRINLPIFVSQSFLVSLSILNTLIFGQLGEKVISSIAIVDKINSIYWPIISAIATVMTIYFIQYTGANNKKGVKSIFILSNLLMLGMSLIVFLIICFFGKTMISLYSKEISVINDSYFYLWFIALSNIIATGTYSLITYFNGVGRVKESSILAMIQTLISFSLYYLFVIKINRGFLEGIKGIAIAITITKTLEFLFYLWIYKKRFSLKKTEFSTKELKKLKGIDRKIFPLIFNNLMFMIASNIIFIGFSKMGVKQTAAVGIADGLIGNFSLLLIGVITSSKIIIGTYLGKNKMNVAYVYSKILVKILIIGSVISVVFMNILARTYLNFFKIDTFTLKITINLIFIASLIFILKMLNNLLVDGILRIGGDIKAPLYNDLVGIFIFGVVTSLIFTRIIKVPIEYLYLLVSFNEIFRLILNYKRYKEKKWLKKSVK